MSRLRLSAVVPTCDRPEILKPSLDSLLAQERALDEILVVENGPLRSSTLLASEYGPKIRFLFEPRRGVDHARNRGVAEARGDIVLFLDDDCRAATDWSARLEDCFRDPGVRGAGGPTEPEWESEPPPRLLSSRRALSYIGIVDLGPYRRPIDPERDFLIGANMAWRKEALVGQGFEGVCAFPPTGVCAEDFEFSRRQARLGLVIYEPLAVVRHRIGTHKTGLAHVTMRGFYFSAAKARLDARGRVPSERRSWLWELPISVANLLGRTAAHLIKDRSS